MVLRGILQSEINGLASCFHLKFSGNFRLEFSMSRKWLSFHLVNHHGNWCRTQPGSDQHHLSLILLFTVCFACNIDSLLGEC